MQMDKLTGWIMHIQTPHIYACYFSPMEKASGNHLSVHADAVVVQMRYQGMENIDYVNNCYSDYDVA
jgi:hypothetical protein